MVYHVATDGLSFCMVSRVSWCVVLQHMLYGVARPHLLQCVAVCLARPRLLQDRRLALLTVVYGLVFRTCLPCWRLIVLSCCNVLHCVAMCCNVLQCVAMCCNVLHCVAVVFLAGVLWSFLPCLSLSLSFSFWRRLAVTPNPMNHVKILGARLRSAFDFTARHSGDRLDRETGLVPEFFIFFT